ncbi:hypothetical protein D3C74_424490 [compost metagenome]
MYGNVKHLFHRLHRHVNAPKGIGMVDLILRTMPNDTSSGIPGDVKHKYRLFRRINTQYNHGVGATPIIRTLIHTQNQSIERFLILHVHGEISPAPLVDNRYLLDGLPGFIHLICR